MAIQTKLTELPPLCMVEGCGRFRQRKNQFTAIEKKPFLKTCRTHTYQNIKDMK